MNTLSDTLRQFCENLCIQQALIQYLSLAPCQAQSTPIGFQEKCKNYQQSKWCVISKCWTMYDTRSFPWQEEGWRAVVAEKQEYCPLGRVALQ